ncbi:MAG: hypothetical protein LBJ67_00060 [Planctomycetaceae bacterium]|nr:hypothetical protein [Planctomycetaceae bacterium]
MATEVVLLRKLGENEVCAKLSTRPYAYRKNFPIAALIYQVSLGSQQIPLKTRPYLINSINLSAKCEIIRKFTGTLFFSLAFLEKI